MSKQKDVWYYTGIVFGLCVAALLIALTTKAILAMFS